VTARVESLEIAGADGRDRPIRGDAFVSDEARAGVVLCHGFKGFARWGFLPHLARALTDAGLNVVAFDFSGSGIGADRQNVTQLEAFEQNTFTKELVDLEIVWTEGERRGWLPARAGLFGFSRGGGVAILHTARDPRVRALVTWSAISTIRRWHQDVLDDWRRRGYADVENARTGQWMRVDTGMLHEIEERSEIGQDLNILDAAERVAVPWLIVHGTADETVPVHEGRQLHTASGNRAELALIDGANHGYGASHPFASASDVLAAATERTVRFFVANLVA
jgi:uncharacterized protein